jgi:arabinogalactan oligomer/maltooligosaccharide transport system substrate-binding protein
MKGNKIFAMSALLVVLALIVVACGTPVTPAPVPTTAPAQATAAPAQPTAAPAQPTAAPAQPTAAPAQPTTAPAATGDQITGELTLWHAYGTGSSEEKALGQIVESVKAANPGATINVLQVPFDQLFNKYETEAAAGGGPDLWTAPNDNLGNEVRAGLLAPLDDLLRGKLDAYTPLSVEGVTVDGKLYAVPVIVKAVALYHNKSTVPTAPKTTQELLDLVKSGKKLVLNQNAYHNFGFFPAFGGKLLGADGTCTADQGGFTEAMQYLVDLKAAGAQFETDGGKADTLFRQGQVDMIVNGPWVLGDYKSDLGENLGVVPMPAGPGGAAGPLSGIDGWYVNVNASPEKQAEAVKLALALTTAEAQKIYADVAGSPSVRSDVTATDPLVNQFALAGSTGFPRPQSAEFGNYWAPFGDMVTKVLEGKSTPAEGVKEACDAMNKANNKTAGGATTAVTLPEVTGEVTIWNAYGTGSAEEKALAQVLDMVKAKNPNATINVLQIPFDQVFNKFETEVAAGGGPDMFTVPNDNLGNEVRAGLLAPVDDLIANYKSQYTPLAIDGLTVDGKIYGTPVIVKAVALYYNKDTVPTPPKTTDDLLALVKSGKKLVLNQNAYHNFGFSGAFGGKLLADDGTCIADQGGWTEAMQYLADLKAAGAQFETDGGKADTLFRQGQVDMIVNGPWVLGDYKSDLGDKVGVVPMPAGAKGAANPLSGIDGWYINSNTTGDKLTAAFNLSLWLTGAEAQKIYADVAGAPTVRNDVTASDPLVAAFASAGSAGFPRPQSKEFGNFWAPFGDMVTKVLEGKSDAAAGVTEACAAMNQANGK